MHPHMCSVVLFFYLRIFHEEELHYVASMYDTIRTFGFGLADPSALRGVRSRSDHSDDLPILPRTTPKVDYSIRSTASMADFDSSR